MKTVYGHQVCESLSEVLDPAWTAVLAIDMQNDAMHPDGKLARAGNDISGMREILPRCAAFLSEARRVGVPIYHVRAITLENGDSLSGSWIRARNAMSNVTDPFLENTWGLEFCDEVAPEPGEVVITKYRSSAFVGTGLDLLLKARGVRTVVVIGEQTPGCVEATYRDAAYHDFYNVLVEDCVAAFRRDLHDASILIQRARHDVTTAAEVVDVWHSGRQTA